MFALSKTPVSLSPHCMKFHRVWLYDLRVFHEFWKSKVQNQPEVLIEKQVWTLLLKFYGLHVFSPLSQARAFLQDYVQHFRLPLHRQQIDKIFSHLHRLGIHKLGHLHKIPFSEIQRRWGKDFTDFVRGLVEPEIHIWPWEPHRQRMVLESSYAGEWPLQSHEEVLQICESQLERWLKIYPRICIQKMELSFFAQREEADSNVELLLDHLPLLSQELPWILRVLRDRLSSIQFDSPIENFQLKIYPQEREPQKQLLLFSRNEKQPNWKELSQKLAGMGFFVFRPQLLPSHLPELSWKKIAIYEKDYSGDILRPHQVRPLIQYSPQAREEPRGHLFFTERVEGFDSKGERFLRDYYLTYQNQKWLWIFKDQNARWFEQGLAE